MSQGTVYVSVVISELVCAHANVGFIWRTFSFKLSQHQKKKIYYLGSLGTNYEHSLLKMIDVTKKSLQSKTEKETLELMCRFSTARPPHPQDHTRAHTKKRDIRRVALIMWRYTKKHPASPSRMRWTNYVAYVIH